MSATTRPQTRRLLGLALALSCVAGCSNDDSAPQDAQTLARAAAREALLTVPTAETWKLAGLKKQVHVVHTEGGVAHIYAADRDDLTRVHGFVAARDRFFIMDLLRRLGLGRVGELFGSLGVASDVRSRGIGMTGVADRILKHMSPELTAVLDGYAEGINAYIAAVEAGQLPAPSEVLLAAPLLGHSKPTDMMQPFSRRDVAGVLAVVLFEQGYERSDIDRALLRRQIEKAFPGKPDAELRRTGALTDVFERVAPVFAVRTTQGFGLNGAPAAPPPPPPNTVRSMESGGAHARPLPVPESSLLRLRGRLAAMDGVWGHDQRLGFGSNIWAVDGQHTADGGAILSSDGHLALAVPSLFWRVGLDTRLFGDGETHQLGLTFAGLPLMAAGTNGDVAWSTTYLYGDITDYYLEELQLDEAGLPLSARWQDGWQTLKATDEAYQTAAIKLLGSAGGPQTWTRWETQDGRRIVEIEGRDATPEEIVDPKGKLKKGEALVNVLGAVVVPGDVDGDGRISAISMDLTTLDVGDTAGAVDGFGHAASVGEIRHLMRGLVGWAQNTMAIDRHGSILYSGYNATPCRKNLTRDAQGRFAAGADPRDLLDGRKYGGFRIPLAQGAVDEEAGKTAPEACVVPFERWPQALNPAAGYVVNANNDFAGTSFDNILGNDEWYVGGPWVLGYRASEIDSHVKALAAKKEVTPDAMAAVQGVHRSVHAQLLLPHLQAALAAGDAALAKAPQARSPQESRLAGIRQAGGARFAEVAQRLSAWQTHGGIAESGVATFYHQPSATQRADAVATMIFNAWAVELMHRIFDDEGIAWDPTMLLRALPSLLDGRGPGKGVGLASFSTATHESVFFDDLGTPEVERSEEVLLRALQDALARLAAKPVGHGKGGFGTENMDDWLWGLRHWLRLDSLLAGFVEGGGGALGALTKGLSISPDRLPLAEGLEAGDPRKKLPGFPRGGDYGAVDAAAPNALRSAVYPDDSARDFSYAHGPVMRMVIALGGKQGFEGRNIIPGGQSALTDAPNYDDQLRLWLGNKTWPMRFEATDVVAGATRRELFTP